MTTAYRLSDKNQPIWEKFHSLRYDEIIKRQEAKGEANPVSARINLAQYKEAAILLDSMCKDWEKLTVKIVNDAKIEKPSKSQILNGLLIVCYSNGWINVNSQVEIELIPTEYRQLVKHISGK